jgi:hypothetical protein
MLEGRGISATDIPAAAVTAAWDDDFSLIELRFN